jgi:chromate transporter
VLGFVGSRLAPGWFPAPQVLDPAGRAAGLAARRHGLRRAVAVISTAGALGFLPWLALRLAPASPAIERLEDVYLFFARAAFVTFGGAYAVLAYVGQVAVDGFGWLTGRQMIDGLALAETTPGPLIMVLQFVGFQAGWTAPGGAASPLLFATLAAALTTWATFLPSIALVLTGAPFIERLRTHRGLAVALSSVTAAVVGVIASLGWTLARSCLWLGGQPDFLACSIALMAWYALDRRAVEPAWSVLAGGLIGALAHVL